MEKDSGITVSCDGWTGGTGNQKKFFINLTMSTSRSAFVVHTFSPPDDVTKTKEWTAEVITKFITDLREEIRDAIICVCCDGATRHSFPLIEEVLPSVFCLSCVPHTVDLFLEDCGDWEKPGNSTNMKWFRDEVHQWRKLVTYFWTRPKLLALLNKKTELRLLRPADTRFGTHFIMGKRLLRLKEHLVAVCMSDEFTKWSADKSGAIEVKGLVKNDSFWSRMKILISIFDSTYMVIRSMDGGKGTVDAVIPNYVKAFNTIKNMSTCNFFTKARKERVLELWKARFRYQACPILYVAHALSPKHRGEAIGELGPEDPSALEEVLSRILCEDDVLEALEEYQGFKDAIFEGLAKKACDTWSSEQWWRQFGMSRWPVLAKVARRITAAKANASTNERHWSAFANVLTERRSRLTSERAIKLTDLYFNRVPASEPSYFECVEVDEDVD